MLDKWLYNFFSLIDEFFSKVEKYAVAFVSWLWQQRLKLLRKKRRHKR